LPFDDEFDAVRPRKVFLGSGCGQPRADPPTDAGLRRIRVEPPPEPESFDSAGEPSEGSGSEEAAPESEKGGSNA
jgi:hypothetical protein